MPDGMDDAKLQAAPCCPQTCVASAPIHSDLVLKRILQQKEGRP